MKGIEVSKMDPYIGITGFTSRNQVNEMLRVFRNSKPKESERVFHAGVMMSYKTLNNIPSKWSEIFPTKKAVMDILSHDETDIYPCLHYADYESNTKRVDLLRAIQYAGPYIKGIQLDMIWPDPEIIAHAVSLSGYKIEVILQVGENAFDLINNNPLTLIRHLKRYEGVIHRVLLDKSMGRGKAMNSNFLTPIAEVISRMLPNLGIVFAGGLGPEKTHLVKPLINLFPRSSIDAQGQLSPNGDPMRPISMELSGKYLTEAQQLFA